jgi:hypothetical protein
MDDQEYEETSTRLSDWSVGHDALEAQGHMWIAEKSGLPVEEVSKVMKLYDEWHFWNRSAYRALSNRVFPIPQVPRDEDLDEEE